MGVLDRLSHAWNAFNNENKRDYSIVEYGTSYRNDRPFFGFANEKTIISSIYTRIAVDVASVNFYHARLDDSNRYNSQIDSYLNQCLTTQANIDQSARSFFQDVAATLFESGVVAVVPVNTTLNPNVTGSYDIKDLRIGEILEWYPKKIKVRVYNENTGLKEELLLNKSYCAVIENPLYNVMNQPNSTLQRLIRKLALLDQIDEQTGSGKLDIIIQLPYVIKSETRRAQAETRRKDIEMQLKGSKYGIAYTDGTEKITQLNRPAENNLLTQIEYLTKALYAQLGITEEVINGTATEVVMLNYYNRTVKPVLQAIADEFNRKFLTVTARTQKQAIIFMRDPFLLVPVSQLAEIADKFTRNEILSSNEVRAIIGYPPASDPSAEELRNKNLNRISNQNPQYYNQEGDDSEV